MPRPRGKPKDICFARDCLKKSDRRLVQNFRYFCSKECMERALRQETIYDVDKMTSRSRERVVWNF